MSESSEVLLFLPSWCALTERHLSDIFASITKRDAGVIVVLVSFHEEDVSMTFHHNRIIRKITSKEAVMELLISHQVTQLPFSIICSEIANQGDGSTGTQNVSNEKSYLNDGTCDFGCHQIHDVPLLDSESFSASDLFGSAVEAYDAFNFESAAWKFYAAILKDQLYKSALFNFAGLLHMVGYPTLAVFFIEKVLILDKEDMIAHSFLWALTQLKETSNIGIQMTFNANSFLLIFLIPQAHYDHNMIALSAHYGHNVFT
jgi:hypothetical protein